MQCLVVLWITGCFCTLLTGRTEAPVGLLPMHILLKHLAECSCTHMATLGYSHFVQAVLDALWVGSTPVVPLGLRNLSPSVKHWLISPVKDAVTRCVEFTETFQVLHPEVEPGNRVMDVFHDRIIHHLAPKMSNDQYGDYIKQLDGALNTVMGPTRLWVWSRWMEEIRRPAKEMSQKSQRG